MSRSADPPIPPSFYRAASSVSSHRLSTPSSCGTFGTPQRTPLTLGDDPVVPLGSRINSTSAQLQPAETTRTFKKTRSIERTRTWAQEVARQRGKAQRRSERKKEEKVSDDNGESRQGYAVGWWLRSSTGDTVLGVIDSLFEDYVPAALYLGQPWSARANDASEPSGNEHAPSSSDSSRNHNDRSYAWPFEGQGKSRIGAKGRNTSDGREEADVIASLYATNVIQARPSPPSTPKAVTPILSIDEIVRCHSPAMTTAETAAREKARKEISLASPSPSLLASCARPTTPASSKSSRRHSNSTPPIPSGTTSSLGAPDRGVPPCMTFPTSLHGPSGTQDDSFDESIREGQVLLEKLEAAVLHSNNSPPAASAKRGSLQVNPGVILSPSMARTKSLYVPSTRDVKEDLDLSMAIYLHSPHLNRLLDLPRPFPEKPLRVSLADVGSPTGRPILLFLGLGCVRYLIALFDDIARAFNLRLICIDRWGLGRTDNVPQDRRGLTEWAQVVERVVNEMGVDDFQIVAHSAGAPYACATAICLGGRVKGRLHLLAPWVNSDIDGGKSRLTVTPRADTVRF